jgi:hypothetical protein
MPRFYFNHQDGGLSYPDEDGFEFSSAEIARLEATKALGEAARDELPGEDRRELSIEVLDEDRRPLFRVALRFEVEELAGTN